MDKLNIDLYSLLPYVIEGFAESYGYSFLPIINKRLNNTLIISYHDVDGLNDYVHYLEKCKTREFSIRFLEEIGVDVQKYKNDNNNYTLPIDSEIINKIECTLSPFSFDDDENNISLFAFDENHEVHYKTLEMKVNLINFILGNKENLINKDNLEEFTKTEEFKKVLEKINEYKEIYKKLLVEYKEWNSQLDHYKEYVKKERKRRRKIINRKRNEFYYKLFYQLPPSLKELIHDKPFEEQRDIILNDDGFEYDSDFEMFNHKNMETLKSVDAEKYDKHYIMLIQLEFFERLGIPTPIKPRFTLKDENMYSEEEISEYLDFLNQDEIKKYIPPEKTIDYIISLKKEMLEEAIKEYYTTRDDFIEAMKLFKKNQAIIDYIYNTIKEAQICITGRGGRNSNNEFISIMFYTTKSNNGGSLLFGFIHECGHVIDNSIKGTGFEKYEDFDDDCEKNPYDNKYRKYERFNETINDLFALEVIEYLHNKGLYLIEPKEFTISNNINWNTAFYNKELLQPLFKNFRFQIIKAKINSDPKELTKYIGEENFEELVDVLNKVDYLSRNGLFSKINSSPDDEIVKEYHEQIKRAEQIYARIDDYYLNNYESFFLSSHY